MLRYGRGRRGRERLRQNASRYRVYLESSTGSLGRQAGRNGQEQAGRNGQERAGTGRNGQEQAGTGRQEQAGRQGQESEARVRAKVQLFICDLVYNPAKTESRAGAYKG